MLKIGLTGNMGSGKTTICRLFEMLNAPVFYADKAAKNLMESDEVLIHQLVRAFGSSVYNNHRSINKAYLSTIVFQGSAQLEKLNAIVHPHVIKAFDNWASRFANRPYVIKEAALLFESKSYLQCDQTILVTAPRYLKIQRIMLRDGVTAEQATLRLDIQLPDACKIKLANHCVINDEQHLLIPQVLRLHEGFIHASD